MCVVRPYFAMEPSWCNLNGVTTCSNVRNLFTNSLCSFSEISRLQSGRGGNGLGIGGYRDPIKYVDVYRERPIRLTVRVLVPVREHPKVSTMG